MTHSVLTVILKGEDWSYRKKFNLYEDYKNDEHDPIVSECIQKAQATVKDTPEDIEFKTSKVIR